MNDDKMPTSINYGLRFFAAAILLVPTASAMIKCLTIPKFERIFEEMLMGMALPKLSQWVLMSYPGIALLPLGIFIAACIVLYTSKRDQQPYYFAGLAFIAMSLISSLIVVSLFLPLLTIIKTINE